VVYGCIRDSGDINEIDIGVRALNTHPQKSIKKNVGDRDIAVTLAVSPSIPVNGFMPMKMGYWSVANRCLLTKFAHLGIEKNRAVTTGADIAPMLSADIDRHRQVAK
jgi:hypothetical protein